MGNASYLFFTNRSYHWKSDIDYRQNPQKYLVGRGEQGVLICEPYKSELVQYWRFKTADSAKESSEKIYSMFLDYLERGDFVGADMARKFLQMGFSRSHKHANANEKKFVPKDPNEPMNAKVFYQKWQMAENHPLYSVQKQDWKKRYG